MHPIQNMKVVKYDSDTHWARTSDIDRLNLKMSYQCGLDQINLSDKIISCHDHSDDNFITLCPIFFITADTENNFY